MEFKVREIFMGLMLYGIMWLLMPLKVLHNPPRPIGFSYLNHRGKGNDNQNVVNNEIITEFKIFMGPMPYGITWFLMPHGGLT